VQTPFQKLRITSTVLEFCFSFKVKLFRALKGSHPSKIQELEQGKPHTYSLRQSVEEEPVLARYSPSSIVTLLSNCVFREGTFHIASLMTSRAFKTSEQTQVLRCDSKGNK